MAAQPQVSSKFANVAAGIGVGAGVINAFVGVFANCGGISFWKFYIFYVSGVKQWKGVMLFYASAKIKFVFMFPLYARVQP